MKRTNCIYPSSNSSFGRSLCFSTHDGGLDVLDVLPHLLHLTLELLWRLHNLRLEFADVFLQVADIHLQLGLKHTSKQHKDLFSERPPVLVFVMWIDLSVGVWDSTPKYHTTWGIDMIIFPPVTYQFLILLCIVGFQFCYDVIFRILKKEILLIHLTAHITSSFSAPAASSAPTTSWHSCMVLVCNSARAAANSSASACCSGGMVLNTNSKHQTILVFKLQWRTHNSSASSDATHFAFR